MRAETLPEAEAHLWVARPSEIRDPELILAYDALLTEDERAKVSRYRFEKDRHTSLVTRALVRTVLSRYAAVSPEDWRFIANEFGRPEISEPGGERSLRFNLSHTEGLVVCLVSRDREVGVLGETFQHDPIRTKRRREVDETLLVLEQVENQKEIGRAHV